MTLNYDLKIIEEVVKNQDMIDTEFLFYAIFSTSQC